MEHICWTDDLYTGNALIDGDHRKLIALLNALFDALAKGQANEVIGRHMHALVAYTKEHFAREDVEMQRTDYVASRAHHSEHARLLDQVVELQATIDAGGKLNAAALIEFLTEWLRHHILTADKKLAAALGKTVAA